LFGKQQIKFLPPSKLSDNVVFTCAKSFHRVTVTGAKKVIFLKRLGTYGPEAAGGRKWV
jgi:hypothetical protein